MLQKSWNFLVHVLRQVSKISPTSSEEGFLDFYFKHFNVVLTIQFTYNFPTIDICIILNMQKYIYKLMLYIYIHNGEFKP